MNKLKCKWCGNKLSDVQIKRKIQTCSKSCAQSYRYRNNHVTKKCENCGKLIQTIKGIPRKYCSWICSNEKNFKGKFKSIEQRDKISKSLYELNKFRDCKCDVCGKLFDKWTSYRAHKGHCGKVDGSVWQCGKCKQIFVGKNKYVAHTMHCEGRFDKLIFKTMRSNKNKGTAIESLFKFYLQKTGYKFEEQFLLSTGVGNKSYVCDFYINDLNLIVECDGRYWHESDKAIAHDYKRNLTIKKQGYKLIRFWEEDLMRCAKQCVREAIEYGKSGKHKENRISKRI